MIGVLVRVNASARNWSRIFSITLKVLKSEASRFLVQLARTPVYERARGPDVKWLVERRPGCCTTDRYPSRGQGPDCLPDPDPARLRTCSCCGRAASGSGRQSGPCQREEY